MIDVQHCRRNGFPNSRDDLVDVPVVDAIDDANFIIGFVVVVPHQSAWEPCEELVETLIEPKFQEVVRSGAHCLPKSLIGT